MSNKKPNLRKNMVAMVTIALVLSKFVSAYGQAKDYPAREQRERFQAIGSDPLNHWPDWRGPTGDGRSDATNLPLNWSEAENIVWKTLYMTLATQRPSSGVTKSGLLRPRKTAGRSTPSALI